MIFLQVYESPLLIGSLAEAFGVVSVEGSRPENYT